MTRFHENEELTFSEVARDLLGRFGGAMLPDEAAKAMRMDRQALDEQISSGRVLGLVMDGRMLVPKLQLDPGGSVLDGMERVLGPFMKTGAGPWMAFEFLCTRDPNLATIPIDNALRQGRIDDVVHAAEAYVGSEE